MPERMTSIPPALLSSWISTTIFESGVFDLLRVENVTSKTSERKKSLDELAINRE
jgi:hypothetical protein